MQTTRPYAEENFLLRLRFMVNSFLGGASIEVLKLTALNQA